MQKPNTDIEYIIYCRKSTDESSEHQKQSIVDQIRACVTYAEKEGLVIKKKPKDFSIFESELEIHKEDNDPDIMNRRTFQDTRGLFIVKENKTGKVPYVRKKWRALIELVKKGAIKGIISYSPDRQARNMLEGGELINYVDNDLVELKYTNFHFEPTASGKMMLGIWFVFSKQYSDKLSEDVNRGNKSAMGNGKSIGRYKPGYLIKNKRHIPHPQNFDIIKEAFIMKLDGETDKVIAEFINTSGYKRDYVNDPNRVSYIIADNLGDVWVDEFYYGIFVNGDVVTDLRETNSDYVPMITEEQHAILKERREGNPKSVKKTKHKEEYAEIYIFDNDFIKTEDGYGLSASVPNIKRFNEKIKDSKGKLGYKDVISLHQITYRCTNKDSSGYNIGILADKASEAIEEKMKHFQVGEAEFNKYLEFTKGELKGIENKSKEKRTKKNLDISRVTADKHRYIEKNMTIKKDIDEEKIYENKKKSFDKQIEILSKEIALYVTEERNEVLELEAFISLLNDAGSLYTKASYVQKGKIAKMLFSNMVLDNQKRLHIAVKPGLECLFSVNGDVTENRTPIAGMRIPRPNR